MASGLGVMCCISHMAGTAPACVGANARQWMAVGRAPPQKLQHACLQLRTEVHRKPVEDPQVRTYILIL